MIGQTNRLASSDADAGLVSDPVEVLRFARSQSTLAPPGPRALAELASRAASDLLARKAEIVPLVARANGFNERQAEFAIEGALEPLKVETLETLWRDQALPWPFAGDAEAASAHERSSDGPEFALPRLSVVVGGGAIPQPNLQAVVAAMMVSGRVLYRPSRFDRALVPLLLERMEALSKNADMETRSQPFRISERILCATWPRENEELTTEVIRAADSLVVFGDEATQWFFTDRAKATASIYSYGPKISFAVVDLTGGDDHLADSEIDDLARRFAIDVGAYDQQGCLSPMALYVIGGSDETADRILEALGRALGENEALGGHWGPPALMPGHAAARIHVLRRVYAMDPSGKRRGWSSPEIPGWTLLLDGAEPELAALPGYATLKVARLANGSALLAAVRPFSGQLQAMGLWTGGDKTAGGDERATAIPRALRESLENMGLSRICRLGEMQRPPLDWLHDANPFYPI